MIDREKVINGLECCTDYLPGNNPVLREALDMAIAMLKEREPNREAVEPHLGGVNLWLCGNCGEVIAWDELTQSGIDKVEYKYCPHCGRRIKWNETQRK